MGADVVFVNGAVFVADAARSWASAVAVEGDRIVGVGGDEVVDRWVGGGTEVIDLAGRLLCPGFQDAHVHPRMGGATLDGCNLMPCVDVDEALSVVADHARSHEGTWIVGGGWHFAWFPGGNPTAGLLDTVTGDRPTVLRVADGHAHWANSAALRLAGIDASTPDPRDGWLTRTPEGEPEGTLHEGAMGLVDRVMPVPTPSDIERRVLLGQAHLIERGITSYQDAAVDPDLHATYLRLASDGRLLARVRGSLWWERSQGAEQIERLVDARAEVPDGSRYRADTVKLMLDGVCENHTASLLDPYLGGPDPENRGIDMIDPIELRAHVVELDRLGFQCHFHAIGDAAVRNALDAVAAARAANGGRGNRHHIAHLQVVDPADVPRFRELRVAANIQPLWACADAAMTELTLPQLGEERAGHQYPFADLLAHGAVVAMGSDWPVSTADVPPQLQVATTRRPIDEPADSFLPGQRLRLADGLMAVTAGSSWVNFLDHRTGTLEEGADADLVVLDGDPFNCDPDQIGEIRVDMTMLEGRVLENARRRPA